MKQKRSDIIFLLTILILFSASVSILHGRKKDKFDINKKNAMQHPLDVVSLKQAYDFLQPFIVSRSPEALAQTVEGVTDKRVRRLASMIFRHEDATFSHKEKLIFLFTLALNCSHDSARFKLFDLMRTEKLLYQGDPALLVAASHGYQHIIPMITNWLKDRQILDRIQKNSFDYAVEHNDIIGIKTLLSYGFTLSQEQANDLLKTVVEKGKDPYFVAVLVDCQADATCMIGRHTLLTWAVEKGNKNMVQALLNGGASRTINKVGPSTASSALRIAQKNNDVSMQSLLREYGAHD